MFFLVFLLINHDDSVSVDSCTWITESVVVDDIGCCRVVVDVTLNDESQSADRNLFRNWYGGVNVERAGSEEGSRTLENYIPCIRVTTYLVFCSLTYAVPSGINL